MFVIYQFDFQIQSKSVLISDTAYNFLMPVDSEIEIQHPRHQFKFVAPHYTLGYLIIVVFITIGTSYTILSANFSKFQADSEKIYDRRQLYRFFTSPFAVASFLDLFFMLLGFLWLLFTLTYYERKFSTVYVLFHFLKANIGITIGVILIYLFLFSVSRMKNFITNVGGIFPYTVHIYLKGCLQRPSQVVNHWFLPCPVNRWFMGFLVSMVLTLVTPQAQGCMVVFFYYLYQSVRVYLRYKSGCEFLHIEGPLCHKPIAILQRILPKCITQYAAFCSISECGQKQETNHLDIDSQKQKFQEEK